MPLIQHEKVKQKVLLQLTVSECGVSQTIFPQGTTYSSAEGGGLWESQLFNPQYQNTNSPSLSLYISYRSSGKLLKYQELILASLID